MIEYSLLLRLDGGDGTKVWWARFDIGGTPTIPGPEDLKIYTLS